MPQTLSYQEVSDQLNKTLIDLAAKKKALDDATAIIQKANTEYLQAVEYARGIRSQMASILSDLIPEDPATSRVR